MNKLYSVFKGVLAIVVHFAHGGLLAVGVMVSVFIGLRVSEAGLTPQIMPSLLDTYRGTSAPCMDMLRRKAEQNTWACS